MAICDDYLAVITAGYADVVGRQVWIDINANYLYNNYSGHPWNNTWRQNVAFAIDNLRYMVKHLCQGIGGTWSPVAMIQYLTNCVGGGGVTMDDMLNAMLTATFEQLTDFMGITEAYRVAVWDAPFNEEFYAALARGFKEWGVT